MTEKQPTRRQLKKFWEWCGVRYEPTGDWIKVILPDGGWCRVLLKSWAIEPPLDLNNLFKYAVPKVRYVGLTKPDGKDVYSVGVRNGPGIVGYEKYSFDMSDPALALFWAIEKLIDKERE